MPDSWTWGGAGVAPLEVIGSDTSRTSLRLGLSSVAEAAFGRYFRSRDIEVRKSPPRSSVTVDNGLGVIWSAFGSAKIKIIVRDLKGPTGTRLTDLLR